MRKFSRQAGLRAVLAVMIFAALFSTGCDPTIRATVENGIITTSQSLLTATLQAISGLIRERNEQNATTGTTGT